MSEDRDYDAEDRAAMDEYDLKAQLEEANQDRTRQLLEFNEAYSAKCAALDQAKAELAANQAQLEDAQAAIRELSTLQATVAAQLEEAKALLQAALYWGTFTNLAVPINTKAFLARTEVKPGEFSNRIEGVQPVTKEGLERAIAAARQEKADE